ncbi:DUF4124 domain-containing protein [Thauera sp.]|jgi:hypothetical protein|uniref:DUF4124 domain-containing protein n=1 Tax=Thauera sp. TaxID=1905334 RepID=UPI00260D2B64|nr:DUF4124 domain-containing protein [Thauera sp.]MCK6409774.1 DUF4124 domain-containing protein [Thauera sp.]
MIHPILFAVLLITVVPASAQIYSWKDKDGRTHFGDTPPTSGEVTEIRAPQTRAAQPPAPATGATGNDTLESTRSRSLAERERAFRERRASAAEAEAAAAQEVARKQELEQWCTAAANELAALRAGQRMVRFNARGEREFLDDSMRAAEIRRLDQQTSERCK